MWDKRPADPPCPCPGVFAGRCPATDSARRASEKKKSVSAGINAIKMEASEGLHCEGWRDYEEVSIITHGACGWTRDSDHGTPGHNTTAQHNSFVRTAVIKRTKPSAPLSPNICSPSVFWFPSSLPGRCAVAEKFEKWKLMINDIADQPAS